MSSDVLSKSVHTVFHSIDPSTLDNIHDRWVKVLDIITAAGGDNARSDGDRKNKKLDMAADDEVEMFSDKWDEDTTAWSSGSDNDSESGDADHDTENNDFVMVEDD